MAEPAVAVRGLVTDIAGRPIAAAVIELVSALHRYAAHSDSRGAFEMGAVVAGTYGLVATAAGFTPLGGRILAIAPGANVVLTIQLAPRTAGALVSLGTVVVHGNEALSAGSAPTVSINSEVLSATGAAQFTQTLAGLPGLTLSRPNGGALGLPATLILRGADPKEAVIEIDGHEVNNGDTGDFDISLLDPAQFGSVEVVYGLAPSSDAGANTEGGAVNFQTLEPTTAAHGLLRFSVGSFGTTGTTLQATGADERMGYALQFHRLYQGGEVRDFPILDAATGKPATLGSAIDGTDGLAKLRYSFDGGDGFVEATYLSFAAERDLSAALSAPANPAQAGPGQLFESFAGSDRGTINNWYALDARLPLGTQVAGGPAVSSLTLRHVTSVARQTVDGPANGLSEYLSDSTDRIDEDDLAFDRPLANADLNLQANVRAERLALPGTLRSASLYQTQRWFLARYIWDTNAKIRYTAAMFYSDYSTFGASFDPRFAAVWSPKPELVVRASIGTGFQPPSLVERYVPTPLPTPDARGFINVGNPKLQPDHTTEYELDVEHLFGSSAGAPRGELDVYRVNQRNDDVQLIPANASPSNPQLSYPVNVATAVWQGASITLDQPIGGGTSVELGYDINSAYPLAVPADIVDPMNANFVPFGQFQGVPLHRAHVAASHRPAAGFWWAGNVGYESVNNDLNRPAFALLDAAIGFNRGHAGVALSGTNLTNAYADRFTLLGAGVPYPGLFGPLPTDAYSLSGRSISLMLVQHW